MTPATSAAAAASAKDADDDNNNKYYNQYNTEKMFVETMTLYKQKLGYFDILFYW